MTEQEQDELASAYLDDEVTDDERVQVESDPLLLARVAALRGVAERLGTPLDPPPERDRWIAAATQVLAPPSAPRRPGWRRPAAAVAAVAACFGLAIGLAQSNDGADGDAASTKARIENLTAAGDQATATTTSGLDARQSGATVQPGAAATGAETPAKSATGSPRSLGEFASDAALLDALRRANPPNSAPVTAAPTPSAGACAAADATLSARVAGRDVVIALQGTTITVTDTATCARRTLVL